MYKIKINVVGYCEHVNWSSCRNICKEKRVIGWVVHICETFVRHTVE